MPATRLRNVRVPDSLWQRSMARAADDHLSLSAVIVALLEQYATGELTLPDTYRAPVKERDEHGRFRRREA